MKPYLLRRRTPKDNLTWLWSGMMLLTATIPTLAPADNSVGGGTYSRWGCTENYNWTRGTPLACSTYVTPTLSPASEVGEPTFVRSTQQHSTVPGSPRALLNTTPQDRAPAYTGRAYGPRKVQQPELRGSLLTTLLGVADGPRKQLDWPNPRGARNVSYTIDWNWRGTPQTILGSISAFSQKDWPNPRGYKNLQHTVDWSWRGTPQAILGSIAAFSQEDWPNPRGTKPNQDLGYVTGGLTLLTSAIDNNLPLRVNTDWPNPKGYKNLGYVSDWNWRGTYQGILSSIVPFDQTDWPNPRGAKPNQDIGYTTGGLTLLNASVDNNLPLRVNTDQPNPKGYKNLQYVTDWNWRGTYQGILGSIVPFDLTEWPNPRGAKPNQDLGYTTGGLTLLTASIDNNVPLRVNTDQPNPSGGPLQWHRGWTASFNLLLQTIVPENQLDWPNPPRGARPNQDLGFVASGNSLSVVADDPRKQLDWPVPKGPAQWNRGWTSSFTLVLQTIIPENQFDWPVPKGPQYPIALRTLTAGPFRAAVDDAELPTRVLTEWPNPRGPQYPISLRTFTDSFKLPFTSIRVFKQHDWPVPKGPQYPLSLRAHFARYPMITEFVVGTPDPDRVVCVHEESRIVTVALESRTVTPDERQSCPGS